MGLSVKGFIVNHVLIGECTSYTAYATHINLQYILFYLHLLHRIGQAIDTCSERLDEECVAYEKSVLLEEERADMLTKVLSSINDDTGLYLMNIKDTNDNDKEDAILR